MKRKQFWIVPKRVNIKNNNEVTDGFGKNYIIFLSYNYFFEVTKYIIYDNKTLFC